MGNVCTKVSPETRKRNLLLVARYSLPSSILIKANGITDEKLAQFQSVFDKYDVKKNATMEASSIGEALGALGHPATNEDLARLMVNADVETGDRIGFEHFVKIVIGYIRREDPEVEMKELFKVFDKDGDGLIVANEIRATMKWDDVAIAKFIRGADKNGDGMVDYNEFIRLLVECDEVDDFN